jgi:hypothetical protein
MLKKDTMSIEKSPESSSHTFRFLIGSRNVLYSPIASTGAPIGRITGSVSVDHSHWLECKQTGDRRVFQSQSTQQCGRIVSLSGAVALLRRFQQHLYIINSDHRLVTEKLGYKKL